MSSSCKKETSAWWGDIDCNRFWDLVDAGKIDIDRIKDSDYIEEIRLQYWGGKTKVTFRINFRTTDLNLCLKQEAKVQRGEWI